MNNKEQYTSEESIDLKEVFYKLYRYWYVFVISIFVFISVALLYNQYATQLFKAITVVLIQDDKKSPSMSADDFMQGFGLFSSKKNIENEIGILKSYTLIYKTLSALNLNVGYYETRNFKIREIYKQSPFIVKFDTAIPQPTRMRFFVDFNETGKHSIHANGDNVYMFHYGREKSIKECGPLEFQCEFTLGEQINYNGSTFSVELNPGYTMNDVLNRKFFFEFNNLDFNTIDLRELITIEALNKNASLVNIVLEGANIEKTVDILNMLTKLYQHRSLERKNEIAESTISFIEKQLSGITDSLQMTESRLQNFRSANRVMDISFQAKKIYESMQLLDNEKAILIVKAKYYEYLQDYLERNSAINDLVAPSSMGIEDPLLNNLILQLANLNTEKVKTKITSKEKNPYIYELDQKIQSLKSTILENIRSIIKTSAISLADIDKRINALSAEVNTLPKTERELFSIERKFKLNDAIYTYLLQKHSEAQIAKASNIPDNEIIDRARLLYNHPVFPRTKVNLLIAFCLGLGLPLIFFLIRDIIRNKIYSKEDIEKLTSIPILGQIAVKDREGNIIVPYSTKSPLSESFRSVRTNLRFFSQSKEKQTILFTSSISGEGKTFCAINTACAFAMSGKKTILVGLDLRKPKIFEDFNLSNDKGVSTCLIAQDTLQEVIHHTAIENLDVIVSGPIPPNPAELIESENMVRMMEELNKLYDYVIIDTAPIGLVTDALVLSKFTNINIYVVRHDYTDKRVFETIIKDIEKNNMKHVNILFNGVKFDKVGYGYGYGYGYYGSDNYLEKKKMVSKIKKFFKHKA